MGTEDTSLGGEGRSFPVTSWGLISRLGFGTPVDHRSATEDLCRRYWKPVYYYIRIARSKSNEEAKDLTQTFFMWLLEGDAVTRYAPEKGSFRHYLKLLLKRFVKDQDVAAQSQKRGGGRKILSLNDSTHGADHDIPDPSGSDPEKAFDEEWLNAVAQHALDRVRQRLSSTGRQIQLRVFEAYDFHAGGQQPSYTDIAAKFGISEGNVRDYLHAVRRELRAEVRAELTRLTSTSEDLEEEWKILFKS